VSKSQSQSQLRSRCILFFKQRQRIKTNHLPHLCVRVRTYTQTIHIYRSNKSYIQIIQMYRHRSYRSYRSSHTDHTIGITCTYTYTYKHIHTYKHTHAHISISIHACIHASVHTHTYQNTYKYSAYTRVHVESQKMRQYVKFSLVCAGTISGSPYSSKGPTVVPKHMCARVHVYGYIRKCVSECVSARVCLYLCLCLCFVFISYMYVIYACDVCVQSCTNI
jgi:hypothetical protein